MYNRMKLLERTSQEIHGSLYVYRWNREDSPGYNISISSQFIHSLIYQLISNLTSSSFRSLPRCSRPKVPSWSTMALFTAAIVVSLQDWVTFLGKRRMKLFPNACWMRSERLQSKHRHRIAAEFTEQKLNDWSKQFPLIPNKISWD